MTTAHRSPNNEDMISTVSAQIIHIEGEIMIAKGKSKQEDARIILLEDERHQMQEELKGLTAKTNA